VTAADQLRQVRWQAEHVWLLLVALAHNAFRPVAITLGLGQRNHHVLSGRHKCDRRKQAREHQCSDKEIQFEPIMSHGELVGEQVGGPDREAGPSSDGQAATPDAVCSSIAVLQSEGKGVGEVSDITSIKISPPFWYNHGVSLHDVCQRSSP
jgi:hypothetical protein